MYCSLGGLDTTTPLFNHDWDSGTCMQDRLHVSGVSHLLSVEDIIFHYRANTCAPSLEYAAVPRHLQKILSAIFKGNMVAVVSLQTFSLSAFWLVCQQT